MINSDREDDILCVSCIVDYVKEHGSLMLGDEPRELRDGIATIGLCDGHSNRDFNTDYELAFDMTKDVFKGN